MVVLNGLRYLAILFQGELKKGDYSKIKRQYVLKNMKRT
jgi:hypothetical protein